MNDIKRYSLSEFAEQHTHPVGPGSYVLATDYDALHAEAEALRAENGRLAESLRIAHHNMAVGFDTEAALSSQLEAARGLLRELHSTMAAYFPDENPPAHEALMARVAACITATPASEVQCGHAACKSLGEPHPFCNFVQKLEKAEQGERQEDQVMGRVHHNPDHAEPVRAVLNSIGRQLLDNAPLYATPRPGPDVRPLVEALETCLEIEERPAVIHSARAALAAHRQANQ